MQNFKEGIKFEHARYAKKVQHILASIISVKVKKILGKSQAQVWEKLRKLRLRQNDGFLIKKPCILAPPLLA